LAGEMARKRSQFVIVVVGVMGFAMLAFMMKFAVESDSGITDRASVRRALLADYGDRGMTSIAVRNLPRKRGYEIKAVFDELPAQELERLGKAVATTFLTSFQGKRRKVLKISLRQSSRWGCSAPAVVFEKDFSASGLRREIDVERALERLVGHHDDDTGLRIIVARCADANEAIVEFAAPPRSGEQRLAEDAIEDLFREAENVLWKTLRRSPVQDVTLVLRSSGESEMVLKEARVVRRKFGKKHVRRTRPVLRSRSPGE